MKQIKRWVCPRFGTAIGVSLCAALLASVGSGQEDTTSSPALVARPVELPPAEAVTTNPAPRTAVSSVRVGVPSEEPVEIPPPPPKAPEDYQTKKTLAQWFGEGEEVILRNVVDLRQLRIPVPWRAKWPEMRVDLQYQNSGALIPERSQMEIWWAGGMVAQKALDGGAADGRFLSEISNRQLRPGAHPLELRILHQTAEKCGDPFGESLWTQIDPSASSITLQHQLRSLSPVLSDFPRLMDRYGWEPYRLRVVTAEAWAITGIHLEWISRVIERSALMLESIPMEVTHGSSLAPTGDHMVIGLRDEIAAALPESIAAQITESFAGIFPHPEDDRFFIAVIAGGTREGIEKAVRVFAATEFSLPPAPVLDLSGVSLPELPPGPPYGVLEPGEERSFSRLGSATRELQGLSTERLETRVHLPPGLDAGESANLLMKLRMAWSPVHRDATIDVFVNGNREATIPIGKADTQRFEDYEMELPLRAFRPGKNRISLQPNLIPPNAGECKPVNWDSLRFVLDNESSLRLPAVDLEIKLPELELTARSGIPAANLGTLANPQKFTVFMSDRDSVGLSAGCTLLGKFAQTAGRRIPMAQLSFDHPSNGSNYIAVGREETLPIELIPDGATIDPGTSERALIAQFESPLKPGRIGMIFAAGVGVNIAKCTHELIHPAQWDRLTGDTMTLGNKPGELTAQPGQFIGATVFHDAAIEEGNGISMGAIFYPLAILLLIGGAITLFLRRGRRKSRLPGRVSIDAPMWSLSGEDRI